VNNIDYRKKLGLSYDDKDKATYFLAQIHNFFLNVNGDSNMFDPLIEQTFCNKIGTSMQKENDLLLQLDDDEPRGLQRAWIYLKKRQNNLLDFLFCYVMLINSYAAGRKFEKKILTDVLLDALDSCQISYEVLKDKDGFFIFPKGVQEFDSALVTQPLEWLQDYPVAQTAWIKALKDYSEATKDNASDVADKFRKALETFFQEFFGGSRSLEKYVSDHTYEQYLDKCGIPSDLRSEFKNTVDSYTKFINNNAKHHDKTELNVLEYLMYQTGNIIRFLITLKREEMVNAN